MGRLIYDTFTMYQTATTLGAETTSYSNKMFNGTLSLVQFTTDPSAATTSTGLLSSTDKICLSGDVTGITFAKMPFGTAPSLFAPLIVSASSSGAAITGISTGIYWGDKIPLVNERLKINTSGFTSLGCSAYIVKVVVEGTGST